jgi:Anti-sigma-28 factor, FlgM
MRTVLGTSVPAAIKHCRRRLDDFTDEARQEKIVRLRKSLAEKTYHVRPADLALKIIDHMLHDGTRDRSA